MLTANLIVYVLRLYGQHFYTLQITSRVAVASSALALDPPVRWPRLWYRLLVSHLFALAFFPVSLRFRAPGLTSVSVALQVQGLLGAQVAYVPFLQCRASHSVYLGTASSSVGLGSARAFGSGVGFLLLSRSLSLALTLSFLAYWYYRTHLFAFPFPPYCFFFVHSFIPQRPLP